MEGNQMKMREAFEEIIEKIDAWRTDGTMEHWQYSQLFDIADAALVAPPRNCDVYDPDKAAHMMEVSYCGQMPPSHCDGTNCTRCSFKWFTSSAQEGGAK